MPRRVQLSRARGWRMPANTVKVDRSTTWGNPFKIGSTATHPITGKRVKINSSETSIALYRQWMKRTPEGRAIAAAARKELKSRDLACWCRPDSPCHGDVLLAVANSD